MSSTHSTLLRHAGLAAIPGDETDSFDAAAESSDTAMEVIPIWAGTVMQVAHIVPGRKPAPYLIGEDPSSRFHLSSDLLGGAERWTLVMPDGTVRVPPAASEVVVVRKGGERSEGSHVDPMTTLELGDRMRIRMASVTFVIRAVHAPARLRLPIALDWKSLSFTAASMAFNLVVLAAAFLFPPNTRVLGFDEDFEQSRWGKLLSRATIVDVQEMPEWMQPPREETKAEGGDGQKHKGEDGKMGSPKEKKSDRMYSIKGDADPSERRLGRIQREDVKKTGILSVLSSTLNMPTSKWGSEPMGSDHENYLGALMGTSFGPNFGFDGLGMMGTGDGGDGDGEGTIGLGPGLYTKIGHGAYGGPDGVGYCPPGKVCGGGLKTKPGGKVPPKVKIKGEGHVIGCIGKDAIRRVIRQHINEVRFCYEKGLVDKPDLEGRVNVGFVIKADGAVGGAKIKSSSLGSQAVESCIAKAVERWTFPAPEGCGVVIVTYPFSLVPASS